MNPPLRITIYPGEVIPEYTIRLVGGGIPEPGKHYTLETTVDDFGVFTTSVNPLTIISVIEMDGKEKNVHLFDGTAWIVNEDKKNNVDGKKMVVAEKKKNIKIEFDEEAPTIDDFGTPDGVAEDMIKKWVFKESQAMSLFKRPDGRLKLKIRAMSIDVGPQLKTKLEMFLVKDCPGFEIVETIAIGREYYIVVGAANPVDPSKKKIAAKVNVTGKDAFRDVIEKLGNDPEIQMLAKRYSITWKVQKSADPLDFWKLNFSAPSMHVREMMTVAESIISEDLVLLIPDHRTLECVVTKKDFLIEARPKIFNDIDGENADFIYPRYYVVPTDKRNASGE